MKRNVDKNRKHVEVLRDQLRGVSSVAKANSARRYFPNGIHCMGANTSDITSTIAHFQLENPQFSATDFLSLTESILKNAEYSEEVLLAYGFIFNLVKKNYDDDLLFRFEYWLENYASNWAHVDDLCIKTIYRFLMARPQLIESTQPWSLSDTCWCRRASNVVWVKFIRRPMGSSVYALEKNLLFENCDRLILDKDEYVQKSVGWLLKVSSLHHHKDFIEYIENNRDRMQRSTLRYALEKVDKELRKKLLSNSR